MHLCGYAGLKKRMHGEKNAALPNLVNATGVETLLRFPSSARFDEFPVHGKSFPLRKTISCSLQVEFSSDWGKASGKWMEAMATVFWNGEMDMKHVQETRRSDRLEETGFILLLSLCFSMVCRRGEWFWPTSAADSLKQQADKTSSSSSSSLSVRIAGHVSV